MNDMELTFIEALLFAREGKDPSKAIENQEKRGQYEVIRNQRLPIKSNRKYVPLDILHEGIPADANFSEEGQKLIERNVILYTKLQYERMGIKVVSEYDDLFYNVILPEGWEIKLTDHSMWNNLYDNKGRKRANFFYKAAFYDRDSFINFNIRYNISVDHIGDIESGYEIYKSSDLQGIVKDEDNIIYKTEPEKAGKNYKTTENIRMKMYKKLEDYMQEKYPYYKDINAYWD